MSESFLRLPEPVVEAGVNALIGVRGDHHFPGVDQEAVQKVFCAMLLEYCAHLQATGQDAHGYSEQLASIALRWAYADHIGERFEGMEQEAYAVQSIAQELMAEFARAR